VCHGGFREGAGAGGEFGGGVQAGGGVLGVAVAAGSAVVDGLLGRKGTGMEGVPRVVSIKCPWSCKDAMPWFPFCLVIV
jgi:hypothetical protein